MKELSDTDLGEHVDPEWKQKVKQRQFELLFNKAKIEGKSFSPSEITPDGKTAIVGRRIYQWDDYFFTWIRTPKCKKD